MSTFMLSERSKRRLENVNPKLVAASDLAITLTHVDFGVLEGEELPAKKAKVKMFSGSKGKQRSRAVEKASSTPSEYVDTLEFYAVTDGKESYNPFLLTSVACAFLQAASYLGHKIEWGGFYADDKKMGYIRLLNEA